MGQLVSECEHLSRFGVGIVHEDKRRVVVYEYEAAEFSGVELTTSVVANDTVEDDQHTLVFHGSPKCAQSFRPSGILGCPLYAQPNSGSHLIRYRNGAFVRHCGADKIEAFLPLIHQEIPHPGLAQLHCVDRLDQIRAWPACNLIPLCPEMADR